MSAVLVTGATGFLGNALCRLLAARGTEVIATGRNPEKLEALAGVRALRHDLAHPIPAEALAGMGRVDAVIHSAGLSSHWGSRAEFESGNVTATANAIAAARALGVRRLVHISTPSVYLKFEDQFDLPETAPLPEPINDYARTKRQAELLVLDAPDLAPLLIRPRGLYGRGDSAILPRLMRSAARGPMPLFRDGVAATDLTHVDDVAEATLAALDAPEALAGEIFNVSGGVALRIRDVVDAAGARLGITPRWRPLRVRPALAAARAMEAVYGLLPGRPEPRATAYAVGLLAYSQTLDIAKAERLLGWRPRIGFAEGLDLTYGRPGSQAAVP